jgi:hypothetical protein
MVKTPLVGPSIEQGEDVFRLLDEAKVPISVALWMLEEPDREWKLVLGTPLYDRDPREAFRRSGEALRAGGYNEIDDVYTSVQGHHPPLIRELRKLYRGKAGIEGLRLRKQSFGGVYMHDGYLYRVK